MAATVSIVFVLSNLLTVSSKEFSIIHFSIKLRNFPLFSEYENNNHDEQDY